jgi:hypothetical protein
MQKWLFIILGVILLVGILFYFKYSRITRLKRRYMQLTHQSHQIAYESLQWQLNKLKTKTPASPMQSELLSRASLRASTGSSQS